MLPPPANIGQMQITAALETSYNPDHHYPPIGEPDTCLIIALDCEQFTVLGHTGRFLHAQISCAGLSGEDIGLEGVPDEPGYFVMDDGIVSAGYDVVSNEHYAEIGGNWRPAEPEDFARFDVALPHGFRAPAP